MIAGDVAIHRSPVSGVKKTTNSTRSTSGGGVNISLDKLARSFSDASGSTLPEYFKLPIEFSIGYHFQADVGDLLFESIDEDLGIDDSGLTYSVGLKW